MCELLIPATIILIVAMIGKIYVRNHRHKNRSAVVAHQGIRVPGSVSGVKPKSSFDHARNEKGELIMMKIKYIDPYMGLEKAIDYYASPGIPGLHPYILSASGYIDTAALSSAFKAVRDHRKELINKGFKGAELKDAVKHYALKISENPSRSMDSSGYIVFDANIPVDVYVLPDDETTERKIHVEFGYDPKNNSELFKVD